VRSHGRIPPPPPDSRWRPDPHPGFVAYAGRCWRMVYSKQLQGDPLHGGAGVDGPLVLAAW
jgi:hypothetical protein